MESIRAVKKVEGTAGGLPVVHYDADVQFTAADGTSHAPHISVPPETLDKFHFGESVQILYDPEQPENTKWPGGSPESYGVGIGILIFGIALLSTSRRE